LLQIRRHAGRAGGGGQLVVVVGVDEEERPVLPVVDLGKVDRPAHGPAQPVAVGSGQWAVAGIREPVVGVHGGVAPVVVTYAVNLVGAALRNHVDDRAAGI